MIGFMSEKAIKSEIDYIMGRDVPIEEKMDEINYLTEDTLLTEVEYNKVTEHLRMGILDIDLFVERNPSTKRISNPRAFFSNGIPSEDGLLSNTIFGLTAEERMSIFGYIELNGHFMDPSCYKAWCTLDRRIKQIVHGTDYFKIMPDGSIEQDPNGDTGIDFLYKNIKKIKFKQSQSEARQIQYKFLEQNRDNMFITKYLVIPVYYRDKNTTNGNGSVGLGGINKLYQNLIVASNGLQTAQDYMFDTSDAMKARVQETILAIYDFLVGNNNSMISKTEVGAGMKGKLGLLRRTNMSKTSNFSSRLVISAPELKAENPDAIMVNFDYSAVPLYACITQFRDFVMYNVRRFFENEFSASLTYPVLMNGKLQYLEVVDPAITFSDDRIKQEMDRFLHGYNNRFVPVMVPCKYGDKTLEFSMMFKGRNKSAVEAEKEPESIYHRRMTWCDIFYMACVEAVKNRHVLITRFPIDFFTNHIMTKVIVSSTKVTEPMYFNDQFYQYYPKIEDKDIGSNTSNSFIDTLIISNLYLKGMGGDYDGDQCTCKGVYTNEANEELAEYMNSKENFVTFGCGSNRDPGSDCIQSIYALTKILSSVKVTPSASIKYK